MRLSTCTLAFALFVPVVATADDAPKVRPIDTAKLKLAPQRQGKATEPAVLASADDLAKSPVVGKAADELAEVVDFDKEKLVVFAWAGSGQDKVTTEGVKDETASFTYTRGLTRDLRQHVQLFAVPKAVEKIEVTPGR